MSMQYEPLESKSSLVDVSMYDSYNEFAAAKVEELSDMIVILCAQYEETNQVLQYAQFSWLDEYFKHLKVRKVKS